MLKNPVYTGKIVWNRRDFATGRQNGGGARMRAQDEWVVSEEAHLPIVSEATFSSCASTLCHQDARQRELTRQAQLCPVRDGQVLCWPCAPLDAGQGAEGPPLLLVRLCGRLRRDGSDSEHAGQKSISAREDRLLRLAFSFFEQRIFGPLRIERLEKQLRSSARDSARRASSAEPGSAARSRSSTARSRPRSRPWRRASSPSWSPSGSRSCAARRRRSKRLSPRSEPRAKRPRRTNSRSTSHDPGPDQVAAGGAA